MPHLWDVDQAKMPEHQEWTYGPSRFLCCRMATQEAEEVFHD